jgi:hypothetical protein
MKFSTIDAVMRDKRGSWAHSAHRAQLVECRLTGKYDRCRSSQCRTSPVTTEHAFDATVEFRMTKKRGIVQGYDPWQPGQAGKRVVRGMDDVSAVVVSESRQTKLFPYEA